RDAASRTGRADPAGGGVALEGSSQQPQEQEPAPRRHRAGDLEFRRHSFYGWPEHRVFPGDCRFFEERPDGVDRAALLGDFSVVAGDAHFRGGIFSVVFLPQPASFPAEIHGVFCDLDRIRSGGFRGGGGAVLATGHGCGNGGGRAGTSARDARGERAVRRSERGARAAGGGVDGKNSGEAPLARTVFRIVSLAHRGSAVPRPGGGKVRQDSEAGAGAGAAVPGDFSRIAGGTSGLRKRGAKLERGAGKPCRAGGVRGDFRRAAVAAAGGAVPRRRVERDAGAAARAEEARGQRKRGHRRAGNFPVAARRGGGAGQGGAVSAAERLRAGLADLSADSGAVLLDTVRRAASRGELAQQTGNILQAGHVLSGDDGVRAADSDGAGVQLLRVRRTRDADVFRAAAAVPRRAARKEPDADGPAGDGDGALRGGAGVANRTAVGAGTVGHAGGRGVRGGRTIEPRQLVVADVSEEDGVRQDEGFAAIGDGGAGGVRGAVGVRGGMRADPVRGAADGKRVAAGGDLRVFGGSGGRGIRGFAGCDDAAGGEEKRVAAGSAGKVRRAVDSPELIVDSEREVHRGPTPGCFFVSADSKGL